MIIQNLLGKKAKRYWVKILMLCWLNITCAKDLFLPLKDIPTDWVLTELNPVPFRIQYHGNVKLPDGKEKYVFLVNGRCVYASLKESMPDQFILKQVIAEDKSILIQDKTDGCMYTLKLGENTYRPMCFCGKILNKTTGTYYTFSHVNNHVKFNGQDIVLALQQNDFNSIKITILAKDKVPFSYILHKNK